jgi:glycosyltransferase involved in cell wall biosynthesis
MTEASPHRVPVISVLMTVFNGRRYLRASIESILSQACQDFEFLIIDDGSTDSSPQILAEYARRDSRVRILSHENKGLTKSLNEGLREVRGKYLARMDSDDISLPQRFERQVKFLDQHPDHVMVGSRCMLIDPAGYPIREKRDIVMDHEQIDQALLKMSWPVVHPAVMMRTDALRSIGGYDERFGTNQDHDLFLRLAEVGKLANLSEVLLFYRQHFDSVGFTKVESQSLTVIEIARAAHERRGIAFPDFTPGKPQVPRPLDHHRKWTWWALAAGNVATARRHALAVVRGAPLDKDSWRMMYCALRGR